MPQNPGSQHFAIFSALLALLLPSESWAGVYMPGCEATGSGEELIEYRASVILNLKITSGPKPPQGEILEAIEQQARYLFAPTSAPGFVPSAAKPEIEILTTRERTYPFALTIDRFDHPWASFNHDYVKKALKRGSTFTDDPALEVSYVARVRVTACQARKDQALPEALDMPIDPHLIYWMVPKNDRRPMRFGAAYWVANPCATPEVAEMIEPTTFWYVWSPRQKSRDADGADYDCARLMKPGTHFAEVKLKRSRETPAAAVPIGIGNLELKPGETLRITAVYGIWNSRRGGIDPQLFKSRFDPKKSFRENMVAIFADTESRQKLFPEAGSFQFLNFLRDVADLADVKSFRVTEKQKDVLVSIEGKLKESGRAFRLNAFFGNTDSSSGQHWVPFYQGLIGDQVILYSGHSGLGSNLDLAAINKRLKLGGKELEVKVRRQRHQLIGILSCYSYRYYESHFLALRGAGTVTDILSTGTPHFSHRIYPILLKSIDAGLAGKTQEFEPSIAPLVHPGNFLVLKRRN